ncbi:MAG: hypothetical protein AB9903_12385 [Vulcanimicrobiota bacterium]
MSLSDDEKTALVGATFANSNRGEACIYVKGDSGWELKATFANPTATAFENFGYSVSISGDGKTALVGAQDATVDTVKKGAAYVYVKGGDGWVDTSLPKATLTSVGSANDHFGISVALSDDGSTALIEAYSVSSGKGAAYIFAKGDSPWEDMPGTFTAKLTDATGSENDYFGATVSISGDGSTALVGTNNSSANKAYIY